MRDINDLKSDLARANAKLVKAEEHLVITQQRIEKRRLSIQRLEALIAKAAEKPAPAEKKAAALPKTEKVVAKPAAKAPAEKKAEAPAPKVTKVAVKKTNK